MVGQVKAALRDRSLSDNKLCLKGSCLLYKTPT